MPHPRYMIALGLAVMMFINHDATSNTLDCQGDRPRSLWADAVCKSPRKARPYHGVSHQFYDAKMYRQAYLVNMDGFHYANADKWEFVQDAANMLLMMDEFDRGIEMLKLAVRQKPSAASWQNLGSAYFARWNTRRVEHSPLLRLANDAYSEALRFDEQNEFVLDSWADTMYYGDLYGPTVTYFFSVARTLNPEECFVMGKWAINERNYPIARMFLDAAAHRMGERNMLALFYLASTEYMMGDLPAAETHYIRVLRYDPTMVEATSNLILVRCYIANPKPSAMSEEQYRTSMTGCANAQIRRKNT